MLIQCGDVCVDTSHSARQVDDGGWLVCPTHRLCAIFDVLMCPSCGFSDVNEALVEQECSLRVGDDNSTIDRFANTTRVRTPMVRRVRKFEQDKHVLEIIRKSISSVSTTPTVSEVTTEVTTTTEVTSSKAKPKTKTPKRPVVHYELPSVMINPSEVLLDNGPSKKRPRQSLVDPIAALREYKLVDTTTGRRSHRCGMYALNVHLRRLCRLLMSGGCESTIDGSRFR